jgi:hypothetical protein
MMPDSAVAGAERTEAARQLIARAQVETVDLVTVSALELCVFDGPRQPVFEGVVAQAWMQVGDRRRRSLTEEVTSGLVRRGLLVDDRAPRGSGGRSYAFTPELGLMLAARCRPTFVVMAAGQAEGLRPMNLFALGDQAELVQGIVVELPAALPPDRDASFAKARKLGPLGWIYRYVLVSPGSAAELLARWTIGAPAQPGGVSPRYLVSAYRPDREAPVGYHLGVLGDGSRAVVDGLDSGGVTAAYDLGALSSVMLGLLTEAAR